MCYSLSLPSKLLLHLLDRHARGIAHFVVHVVRLAQSLTRLCNASDATDETVEALDQVEARLALRLRSCEHRQCDMCAIHLNNYICTNLPRLSSYFS